MKIKVGRYHAKDHSSYLDVLSKENLNGQECWLVRHTHCFERPEQKWKQYWTDNEINGWLKENV